MKILGLDLGTKTVGIALSDSLGLTAQGLETFVFTEEKYEVALDHIEAIVKKHHVTKIVLGYPKNMDGSIGERGQLSEQFKEHLESRLNIEVVLWDERMTTMIAEKILIHANVSRKKRKKVIDKMAAVVILQSYLDMRSNNS